MEIVGAISLGLQHRQVGAGGSLVGEAAALGAFSGGLFGGLIGAAVGAGRAGDRWKEVKPPMPSSGAGAGLVCLFRILMLALADPRREEAPVGAQRGRNPRAEQVAYAVFDATQRGHRYQHRVEDWNSIRGQRKESSASWPFVRIRQQLLTAGRRSTHGVRRQGSRTGFHISIIRFIR